MSAHRHPFSPVGGRNWCARSRSTVPMSTLLAHSALVRPLLSEFVGSIAADGQTTRVTAIALNMQGKAVLLNLVANDTTLSVATARFFKGEQLLFRVADGMIWSAPN